MLDPKEVQFALASGVSFVCAMCTRYHEGQAKKLDKCTAKDNCGSPIIGDTFHEYNGPLGDLARFCFVCGEEPSAAIEVHRHLRRIGVCEKHVSWVTQMIPQVKHHLPVVVTREIHSDEGSVSSEEIPEPKRGKSLEELVTELDDAASDSEV